MQPHVTDVTLTYTPDGDVSSESSDVIVTTIPAELPPIFMGERLSVYAMITPKNDKVKVILTLYLLVTPLGAYVNNIYI